MSGRRGGRVQCGEAARARPCAASQPARARQEGGLAARGLMKRQAERLEKEAALRKALRSVRRV